MADTICKWCDREISEPDNEHPYWHDSDKFLAMTCSGTPNRRHEPAEPSTEGTQAAQPRIGFFRCLSCGFNGTISTDEIAKHRAQCSHGPTVPMSQAEWEARGEPAPVAQVDAGKYDFAKVRSQHFTEIAEEYEPAVAQTELPPIPKRPAPMSTRGLLDTSYTKRAEEFMDYAGRQIASLTQRLQEQDAEIAKLLAASETKEK